MNNRTIAASAGVLALSLAACATTPDNAREEAELIGDARATLGKMRADHPKLEPLLASAVGYAVFPRVGQGGFVVGATVGSGVVFEGDLIVGYASLTQGSVGAQVGAQAFDELIIFRNEQAFRQFKAGDFSVAADAAATLADSGAAVKAVTGDGPVAVLIDDEKGAMARAVVAGQKLSFERR